MWREQQSRNTSTKVPACPNWNVTNRGLSHSVSVRKVQVCVTVWTSPPLSPGGVLISHTITLWKRCHRMPSHIDHAAPNAEQRTIGKLSLLLRILPSAYLAVSTILHQRVLRFWKHVRDRVLVATYRGVSCSSWSWWQSSLTATGALRGLPQVGRCTQAFDVRRFSKTCLTHIFRCCSVLPTYRHSHWRHSNSYIKWFFFVGWVKHPLQSWMHVLCYTRC